MAQIPVFVVVKGDEDIKRLTGAIEQMAAKTNAANASASKMSGLLAGIGAGVGLGGMMSVSAALGTMTDFLGDSVRAAMESERVTRQLGITLRDNIPAWRGNTAAIDAAIEARKRLAFDDEDLAQSIGTLVAATKNEQRALELQTLAMNLARFRGIDLATATDAVAKAAMGSTKALNSMVPATRGAEGATQALEIAMAATQGQAEAYADTMAGRMEGASNRFEDSQENLGERVMPLVTGAMELAVGAIDALASAAGVALGPLSDMAGSTDENARKATDAAYAGDVWTAQLAAYLPPALAATVQTNDLADATASAWNAAINGKGAYYDLVPALVTAGNAAATAAAQMRLLQMNANDATTAAKVNAAGSWTAATAQQALAVGLNQSSVGAVKARTAISSFGSATSGATRATKDYTAAVGAAFDAMRTKVFRVIDAIHQKNLDAIEDARKTANALLDKQISDLQAGVDAEQAKLDAKRAAQRKADLEAAVAQAETMEERARAQAELDDYNAQAAIDAKQREVDAQVATLEAQKDANDAKAEADTKAENARYEAQKVAFERELKLLEAHLKSKKQTWDQANRELLKFLKDQGLDYESVGKTLGTKYADGYVKGVNKAIGSIAAAVAKYLGIDEATIRKLAAASPSAATTATNDASTATAAQGGNVPAAAVGAFATALAGNGTTAAKGVGATYNFTLAINAGAFTGTEADAKRFAQQMWQSFEDETKRRQKVWPVGTEWDKVKENAGV